MTTAVVNNLSNAYAADSGLGATASKEDANAADRFLKLLVTQMQNQDPLNPMDNAQVTSQMAQINTVNGIEKLNTTVKSLSGQFVQMQALQGAALVGREVVVAGNQLSVKDGAARGGFELASPVDSVEVEVLSASGQVVDTLKLGAQPTGMHSFNWAPGKDMPTNGLSFRVKALTGGLQSSPTPLMRASVEAVSTSGNSLQIELGNGKTVPYSDIKAFS
jgi:flagellar basal-body rod modification protein FlgD